MYIEEIDHMDWVGLLSDMCKAADFISLNVTEYYNKIIIGYVLPMGENGVWFSAYS